MERSSIVLLPRAVVTSVFAFVASVEKTDDREHSGDASLPLELVPMALVSHEWHTLVREHYANQRLQTLRIVSQSTTRHDALDSRRQLTLRRRWLRYLEILNLAASETGLWSAALVHSSQLTTLRVYGIDVGYASKALPEIVRAAGQYCPRLDRLELPPFVDKIASYPAFHRSSQPEDDDESDGDCPALGPVQTIDDEICQQLEEMPHSDLKGAFVDTIFESANNWRRHGRPGLQHLCFSAHEHITNVLTANDYISKLAECCPQLKVLEGYEGMHRRGGSGEKWTMDLATWTRLNRACTQLTEFNWLSVPFATRFFEIFGDYKKLQLTKLTIATVEQWNWPQHLNELGIDDRCELIETGYGTTATNAHAMLQACPNLVELEVQCFFPTATKTVMNVDQFGDVFCETLSIHCRQLTSLTIRPRYGYWTWPGSIKTLKDRSMTALATLPLLRRVNITGVNITGDGLYTLAIDHAKASKAVREYEIRIGHVYEGLDLVDHVLFYRILEQFLDRLATETRDLTTIDCCVTLRLINEGSARLDEPWLVAYLQRNRERRTTIREKHPSVTIEQTDKGKELWGIREFVLTLNLE